MCEVLSTARPNASAARQLAAFSPPSTAAGTGNATDSPEVAACCGLATCPATPVQDLIAHHSNNRAGQAGPDNQAAASPHHQQQQGAALASTAASRSGQQTSGAAMPVRTTSAVPDSVAGLSTAIIHPGIPADVSHLNLAAPPSAVAARAAPHTAIASGSVPSAVAAIAARAAAIGAATSGTLPWTLQRKVFKLPPATLAPQATPAANRAWKEYKTADGEVYHFNSVTKQRCWVLPEGAVVQPVQQQEPDPSAVVRLKDMAKQQQSSMQLLLQQHIQQHEVQQQQQQQQEQQTRWTLQQLQQLRRLAQLPQQQQDDGTMQQHVAQHNNQTSSSDVMQVVTPAVSAAAEPSAPSAEATVSLTAAQAAAAAISNQPSGILQPPPAAGTPNWVEGVNLRATAEELQEKVPLDDRSTLVFIPEAKAVNYLAKVANHFNAAAGTTTCAAWLLYGAGIRVLRPKAGGNAYIWWAPSSMSETATAGSVATGALGGAVPAAATTDAIKCRSAGMAALTLMKQHPNWRQLLGIDAPQPLAAVVSKSAAQASVQPFRAAAEDLAAAAASAAPAGAISTTSSHSSEDGSSAETVSESAAATAKLNVHNFHREVQTQIHANTSTGAISRKRRSSGDSAVTAESAGGHVRVQKQPRLDPAEAAALSVPPAAAALEAAAAADEVVGPPTATPSDPMQVDDSHLAQAVAEEVALKGVAGNMMDRVASTPVAALEAAAGLLLFFSSHGSADAEKGDTSAATAQTSKVEQPSTSKPAVTSAAPAAAAATAQDLALETPLASICPVDGVTHKAATSTAPVMPAAPPYPPAALGSMPWASVMSAMQQATAAPPQSAAAAAALMNSGTGAGVGTPAGVPGPVDLRQYQVAVATAQAHAQTLAAANNATVGTASLNTLQQVLAAARTVPNTAANACNAALQQHQPPSVLPAVARLPVAAAATGGAAGIAAAQLVPTCSQQRVTDVAQLLENVHAVEKQLTEAISLSSMFVSGLETAPDPLALLSHLLNIGDRATQALFMSEAQQLTDNLAKCKQALQLLAGNPVFATAFGGVRDALAQEVDTAAVWLTQRQSYVHQLRSAEAIAQAMVKGLSQALDRKVA